MPDEMIEPAEKFDNKTDYAHRKSGCCVIAPDAILAVRCGKDFTVFEERGWVTLVLKRSKLR